MTSAASGIGSPKASRSKSSRKAKIALLSPPPPAKPKKFTLPDFEGAANASVATDFAGQQYRGRRESYRWSDKSSFVWKTTPLARRYWLISRRPNFQRHRRRTCTKLGEMDADLKENLSAKRLSKRLSAVAAFAEGSRRSEKETHRKFLAFQVANRGSVTLLVLKRLFLTPA